MQKQVKTREKPVNKKNNEKQEKAVHEFDATGKVLGRLATEVAVILRGKDKVNFVPYLEMGDKVVIKNASKIVITGNKIEQKNYYHHTGYLGHLKTVSMKELMSINPSEVIKRAVYGMLPKK